MNCNIKKKVHIDFIENKSGYQIMRLVTKQTC